MRLAMRGGGSQSSNAVRLGWGRGVPSGRFEWCERERALLGRTKRASLCLLRNGRYSSSVGHRCASAPVTQWYGTLTPTTTARKLSRRISHVTRLDKTSGSARTAGMTIASTRILCAMLLRAITSPHDQGSTSTGMGPTMRECGAASARAPTATNSTWGIITTCAVPSPVSVAQPAHVYNDRDPGRSAKSSVHQHLRRRNPLRHPLLH
mmetsp:Transcript_65807/g.146921  ORF Transcript_65807/g.146921 Transcript_65807/m.146921 type:complete len:208 (-) Transcript_65807:319-942(-)